MRIQAPKMDGNKFCGPAVISAATGCTSGEAARLIRAVNRKTQVKGTHVSELAKAFARFGVAVRYSGVAGRVGGKFPTLAGWLRTTAELRAAGPGRVFLVSAGHHWQLIQGNRYTCGVAREVVSVEHEVVRRRARVAAVHELHFPPSMPDPAAVIPPTVAAARRAALGDLPTRCRKLAKTLGVETYYSRSQDAWEVSAGGKVVATVAGGYTRLYAALERIADRRGVTPDAAKLPKKCRELAERLRCSLEVPRDREGGTFWVYGPDDVYDDYDRDGDAPPLRPDPLDGQHACCGWGEVWDALKTYAEDMGVSLQPESVTC